MESDRNDLSWDIDGMSSPIEEQSLSFLDKSETVKDDVNASALGGNMSYVDYATAHRESNVGIKSKLSANRPEFKSTTSEVNYEALSQKRSYMSYSRAVDTKNVDNTEGASAQNVDNNNYLSREASSTSLEKYFQQDMPTETNFSLTTARGPASSGRSSPKSSGNSMLTASQGSNGSGESGKSGASKDSYKNYTQLNPLSSTPGLHARIIGSPWATKKEKLRQPTSSKKAEGLLREQQLVKSSIGSSALLTSSNQFAQEKNKAASSLSPWATKEKEELQKTPRVSMSLWSAQKSKKYTPRSNLSSRPLRQLQGSTIIQSTDTTEDESVANTSGSTDVEDQEYTQAITMLRTPAPRRSAGEMDSVELDAIDAQFERSVRDVAKRSADALIARKQLEQENQKLAEALQMRDRDLDKLRNELLEAARVMEDYEAEINALRASSTTEAGEASAIRMQLAGLQREVEEAERIIQSKNAETEKLIVQIHEQTEARRAAEMRAAEITDKLNNEIVTLQDRVLEAEQRARGAEAAKSEVNRWREEVENLRKLLKERDREHQIHIGELTNRLEDAKLLLLDEANKSNQSRTSNSAEVRVAALENEVRRLTKEHRERVTELEELLKQHEEDNAGLWAKDRIRELENALVEINRVPKRSRVKSIITELCDRGYMSPELVQMAEANEISAISVEKESVHYSRSSPFQSRTPEIRKRFDEIEQELETIDARRRKLEEENQAIPTLRERLQHLEQATVSESDRAAMFRDELERAVHELEDLRAQNDELVENNQLLQDEANRLEEEQLRNQKRCHSLEMQLEDLLAEKNQLEQELSKLTKLEAQVGNLERENESLRAELEETAASEEQVTALRTRIDELNAEMETLQQKLEEATSNERRTLEQLNQIEQQRNAYRTQVEHEITEREKLQERLEDRAYRLEQENKRLASQLEIASYDREETASRLKEKMLQLENENRKLKTEANTEQAMRKATIDRKQATLQNRVRELEAKIEEQQRDADGNSKEIDRLRSLVQRLDDENEELKRARDTLEEENQLARDEAVKLQQQVGELLSEYRTLSNECEQLQSQLVEKETQLAKAEEAHCAVVKELEQQRSQFDELDMKTRRLQQSAFEFEQERPELQLRVRELEREVISLRSEVRRSEFELKEQKAHSEEMEHRSEDLKEKSRKLEKDLKNAQDKLSIAETQLKEKVKLFERQRTDFQNETACSLEKIQRLENELAEMREKLDKAQLQTEDRERRARALEKENKKMEAHTRELELEVEELQNDLKCLEQEIKVEQSNQGKDASIHHKSTYMTPRVHSDQQQRRPDYSPMNASQGSTLKGSPPLHLMNEDASQNISINESAMKGSNKHTYHLSTRLRELEAQRLALLKQVESAQDEREELQAYISQVEQENVELRHLQYVVDAERHAAKRYKERAHRLEQQIQQLRADLKLVREQNDRLREEMLSQSFAQPSFHQTEPKDTVVIEKEASVKLEEMRSRLQETTEYVKELEQRIQEKEEQIEYYQRAYEEKLAEVERLELDARIDLDMAQKTNEFEQAHQKLEREVDEANHRADTAEKLLNQVSKERTKLLREHEAEVNQFHSRIAQLEEQLKQQQQQYQQQLKRAAASAKPTSFAKKVAGIGAVAAPALMYEDETSMRRDIKQLQAQLGKLSKETELLKGKMSREDLIRLAVGDKTLANLLNGDAEKTALGGKLSGAGRDRIRRNMAIAAADDEETISLLQTLISDLRAENKQLRTLMEHALHQPQAVDAEPDRDRKADPRLPAAASTARLLHDQIDALSLQIARLEQRHKKRERELYRMLEDAKHEGDTRLERCRVQSELALRKRDEEVLGFRRELEKIMEDLEKVTMGKRR
ncbi:uncharacterized protein VTP21DRAFT_8429 [Calcarisporiella thermophila]|uniref:uncharacterized protein n=1 Tax=Calcarisporiella thermophila TaxID=911321 RepID=UPI003742D20F